MLSLSTWLPEALGPTVAIKQHGYIRQLQQIILADERGEDIDGMFLSLYGRLSNRRARAFASFLRGQLCLRRKRHGAWRYLDEALQLADGLLSSEGYFVVANRHELLRRLPLQQAQQPAVSLTSLLNEAAVIERLQSGPPPVHFNVHRHDTLMGRR